MARKLKTQNQSLNEDEILAKRHTRYIKLFSDLLRVFPNDKETLFIPIASESFSEDKRSQVHLFVDLSNIYIGFSDVAFSTHGTWFRNKKIPKLDVEALTLTMARGRWKGFKVVCGSYPHRSSSPKNYLVYKTMFTEFKQMSYDVSVMERVEMDGENKEHGVDEMLSYRILHLLNDNRSSPGTIVLATGDGKPTSMVEEIGFLQVIEKALAQDWNVEVYSFGSSLSMNWFDLKDSISNKKNLRILYLDEFIESLYDDSFDSNFDPDFVRYSEVK